MHPWMCFFLFLTISKRKQNMLAETLMTSFSSSPPIFFLPSCSHLTFFQASLHPFSLPCLPYPATASPPFPFIYCILLVTSHFGVLPSVSVLPHSLASSRGILSFHLPHSLPCLINSPFAFPFIPRLAPVLHPHTVMYCTLPGCLLHEGLYVAFN